MRYALDVHVYTVLAEGTSGTFKCSVIRFSCDSYKEKLEKNSLPSSNFKCSTTFKT